MSKAIKLLFTLTLSAVPLLTATLLADPPDIYHPTPLRPTDCGSDSIRDPFRRITVIYKQLDGCGIFDQVRIVPDVLPEPQPPIE